MTSSVGTGPHDPLFDPADFRIGPDLSHVCAGGETPFLYQHVDALQRYSLDKSNGFPGRLAQEQVVEETRRVAAEHWGVAPGDIGFVANVAEGMSILAESMVWRRGDNIVVDCREHPSVVAPFAFLQAQGASVVTTSVQAPVDFKSVVDERTRIIAVSYVSFLTGERMDLDCLRGLADSVGALLVVDFTQAAGYLPLEVKIADFAFSACYKWLLGMTGVAIAFWNRRRVPEWSPRSAGWYSMANDDRMDYSVPLLLKSDARCFSRGNPSYGGIYVLASALEYLGRFDVRTVERHVGGLVDNLLGEMAAAGIASMTPQEGSQRGANVCINWKDSSAVNAILQERGVLAWEGRGRIRFSFHGYNSLRDVERVAAGLKVALTYG